MLAQSLVSLVMSLAALLLPISTIAASQPWVGNFNLADSTCQTHLGPRPEMGDGCAFFDMTSLIQRIGMWTSRKHRPHLQILRVNHVSSLELLSHSVGADRIL